MATTKLNEDGSKGFAAIKSELNFKAEVQSFIVSEAEEGTRMDSLLFKRFEGEHSRTYFQYLIAEKLVLINGEPIKKRIKPKQGDKVEISFVLTPEIELTPENIPLNIIYEDESILVVNKPAGMVVHPAVGNWTGTFVNAFIYHCKELKAQEKSKEEKGEESKKKGKLGDNSLRPGIVHRLDKETSGILVAAKTTAAHKSLVSQFSERVVKKEYLAIVIGNPGSGEVKASIGRNPKNRQAMTVLQEGGKPALTFYETLHFYGKLGVVKLHLKTGRTHQARVHMKHLGCPILGDTVYGISNWNAKYGAYRQLLHAKSIVFAHPKTGEELFFEAPIPKDISRFIP